MDNDELIKKLANIIKESNHALGDIFEAETLAQAKVIALNCISSINNQLDSLHGKATQTSEG